MPNSFKALRQIAVSRMTWPQYSGHADSRLLALVLIAGCLSSGTILYRLIAG